jgi:hypothetical protein
MVLLPGCACCPSPLCDELYSQFKAAKSIEIDVAAEDRVRHTKGTLTVAASCGIPVGGTFGITSWFPGSAYAGRLSLARGYDSNESIGSGNYRVLNFWYGYPRSSVGVCGNLQLPPTTFWGSNPLVWFRVYAPEPVTNTDKTLYKVNLFMGATGLSSCDRTGEEYQASLSGCDSVFPSCPGGVRKQNYVAVQDSVDFFCSETTGLPAISAAFTVGDITQCVLGGFSSDGPAYEPVYSDVFSSGSASVTLSNMGIVF